MFPQISLVPTGLGTLAHRGLSSPALGGQILSDDFNGKGGVPKNWGQILGDPGDVTETPQNLTMTDSTGSAAGIASLVSLVVNPQEVETTSAVLGQIVGYYTDADLNDHGFLYQDGTFTPIDYPGAQSTEVRAINDLGEIVGSHVVNNTYFAFTATAVPEPASLISLASGLVIICTATFLARGRVSGGRR